MNEADLKRVPDGGCTYRVEKTWMNGEEFTNYILLPSKMSLSKDCGWTETMVRQIVGSVNATTLRYRHGWPSTKRPLDQEGKQIESDIDFWTHFAFEKDQA